MGLMLALDRLIADNVVDARQGRWNKAKYSKARGIAGMRVRKGQHGGLPCSPPTARSGRGRSMSISGTRDPSNNRTANEQRALCRSGVCRNGKDRGWKEGHQSPRFTIKPSQTHLHVF